MSWKQLLEQRKIQLHSTSNEELDKLRALIARDLNDSGLTALSADRRFATAYNAALQTTKMVIACAGYRVSSIPGQEDAAIRASELKGAPLGLLVKPFQNEAFLALVCRALREGLFVHPLDWHSL